MDANVREAGSMQVPSQRVIDLTGFHRSTAETGKDQVIADGIARLMLALLALSGQSTLGPIAEMNSSAAHLGFGRDEDQPAAGLPSQRSLNDQLSSLQIDIAPGEREGFTKPQSRGPEERPQAVPAGPARHLQKLPELAAA
jgi:hypothetical protein